MAIEHRFYMDTPISRHALRDALVQAEIGLAPLPDWEYLSEAASESTLVTIRGELANRTLRPDNGVRATRSLCFRDRRATPGSEFETQTVLGVVALLKAFPEADAYWEAYDARHPVLLRRDGRLVLAEALTLGGEHWDAERQTYRALIDLPYTVEPLGPWTDVPVRAEAAPY